MIALLIGAAVGVPYLLSRRQAAMQNGSSPLAPYGSASSGIRSPSMTTPEQLRLPIASPGSQLYASPAPLEGTPRLTLEQVLRFDLTKEWVYRNWARKSTGLADSEFFGVRVPLVTGTGVADVAGSLTYYFDTQGEVQHIAFRGRTGDTTRLIEFLTRNYKFERATAPAGEQLYQVAISGGVQSELRTRPEAVLWSTAPHGSFAIALELARPGSTRVLPPRGPTLQIPPVAAAGQLAPR